jgi:hypothetical protein
LNFLIFVLNDLVLSPQLYLVGFVGLHLSLQLCYLGIQSCNYILSLALGTLAVYLDVALDGLVLHASRLDLLLKHLPKS